MKTIIDMIDSIADSLEYKGMIKEAAALDVVSNTLADARDLVTYKPDLEGQINDKKYNTFRAYLTFKNSNYIDINARTLTHAENIVEGLGFKDQVIEIKKINGSSNTLEKMSG